MRLLRRGSLYRFLRRAHDRLFAAKGVRPRMTAQCGAVGASGGDEVKISLTSKSIATAKATDRSVRSTRASLRSADGRGGRLHMSWGAAREQQISRAPVSALRNDSPYSLVK